MFRKVLILLYFCLSINSVYGQTEVFFTQITHSTRVVDYTGTAPAGFKLYKNNYTNSFAVGVAVPIKYNFSLYGGFNYVFNRVKYKFNIDYTVERKGYSGASRIIITETILPNFGIRYKFKEKLNINLSAFYAYQYPFQYKRIWYGDFENSNGLTTRVQATSYTSYIKNSKWGFIGAAEYRVAKIGRFKFYTGLSYQYLKPDTKRTLEISVANENYKNSYSPSQSFLGLTVSAAYVFQKAIIPADKI